MRQPTYALIDVDPGEKTTWDQVLTLTELYRAALDHMKVRGFPKVTGQRGIQIWVPIEPGPTFEDTRAWVEALSRLVGDTVPGPRELEVGEAGARRARAPRLHAERDQQDARRALLGATRSPARRCRCRSRGTSSTIPICAATAGPIRDAGARLLEVGDLFADVLTTPQQLPPL